MSSPGFFGPEILSRMTAVYKSAVKELKLQSASAIEHERLATCILSIGNSYSDTHRLLEKSVRLYIRAYSASRHQAASSTAIGTLERESSERWTQTIPPTTAAESRRHSGL